MKPDFEYGAEVRLTRNVRNDGTYPGEEVGKLLVRRGSIGVVYDVGTYLQDQIIYRIHFLSEGKTVGCRQEELIPADAPWIPNKFEFREKVVALVPFSAGGDVVVERGDQGEVEQIIKSDEGAVSYYARFNGRVFQVPEAALKGLNDPMPDAAVIPEAKTA